MKTDVGELSYDVGDFFLCTDFDLESQPRYAFVGKITYIKKRKDGCHRYHYQVQFKWGKNTMFVDTNGEMSPGTLNFLCSVKIQPNEVQFCRMLME